MLSFRNSYPEIGKKEIELTTRGWWIWYASNCGGEEVKLLGWWDGGGGGGVEGVVKLVQCFLFSSRSDNLDGSPKARYQPYTHHLSAIRDFGW